MATPNSPSRSRQAFTLVEAMVTIAILSVITIVLVQILAGTLRITSGSYGKSKPDSEARAIFNRMTFDADAMIRDSNSSLIVNANQLTIGIAGTGAGTSYRGEVLVYAVTTQGLQRQERALLWQETGLGPFQDSTTNPAIPAMDAQILGPNVIGMEVRLILADGTVSNLSSAPKVQTFQSTTCPKFLVVGLALTDRQQMKNLGVANPGSLLATVATDKLPLGIWSSSVIASRAQSFLHYYQTIIKIQ